MMKMEDKELKEMLSTSKLKATDNLKDRIIHQINTEKVLMPSSRKTSSPSIGSHFSIFGIMYVLLLTLIGYFYFKTDGNPLESTSFVISLLFTASTFSIYWLIIVYVDFRKMKG